MTRFRAFFLLLLFGFLSLLAFAFLSSPNLEKVPAGVFVSEELRVFSQSFKSRWLDYKKDLESSIKEKLRSNAQEPELSKRFPSLVWMQSGNEKPELFRALRRKEAAALRAFKGGEKLIRLPGGRTLFHFSLIGGANLPSTRVAIDPAEWFRQQIALDDKQNRVQRYVLDTDCRVAFHAKDQMIGKDLSSLKICFLRKSAVSETSSKIREVKGVLGSYLNFSGEQVVGGIRELSFDPSQFQAFSVYESSALNTAGSFAPKTTIGGKTHWLALTLVLASLAGLFTFFLFSNSLKRSPERKSVEKFASEGVQKPSVASLDDFVHLESLRLLAERIQKAESPLALMRCWIEILEKEMEGYQVEFFKYLPSSSTLKSIEDEKKVFKVQNADSLEDVFKAENGSNLKALVRGVRSDSHLFGAFVFKASEEKKEFQEDLYKLSETIALPRLQWLFENIKGKRRQMKEKNGPSQSI